MSQIGSFPQPWGNNLVKHGTTWYNNLSNHHLICNILNLPLVRDSWNMFNIEMTSPNLGHQHLLYFLFCFRSLCTWVSSHAIYWTWNQWCVTPWPSSRQKLIHCFLEDSCLGSDLPVWFPWHITFLDIQWCNLPKTRSPTIWLEAHGPDSQRNFSSPHQKTKVFVDKTCGTTAFVPLALTTRTNLCCWFWD